MTGTKVWREVGLKFLNEKTCIVFIHLSGYKGDSLGGTASQVCVVQVKVEE